MPVKIAEIPRVTISERPIPTIGYTGTMPEMVALPTGFNQGVDQQGQVKIGLKREELAKLLWEYQQNFLYGQDAIKWEHALELDMGGMLIEDYRHRADAIIAKEHELLERKD